MYMQAPHIYDLFDLDSQEAQAQVSFFLSHADGCKRALDVGAGSGTVAFGLARQGISVVCLEPAATMRSLLISRLAYNAELQEYITPLPYNAIDFKLSRRFPLIYATNVLHLILGENERTETIANIVHHLESQGKVIVDFRTGELAVKEREFSGELYLGKVQYRRYTTIKQQAENEWAYTWFFEVYDGEKQLEAFQEDFQIRTDRPDACRKLMEGHGLTITAEHSDYSFKTFDANAGANRLIIVASTR